MAEEETAIVSVEEPDVKIPGGLKASVTPEGRPLTENKTGPVKPFCAPTVTDVLPLAPRWTPSAELESESVKSGAATTTAAADVTVIVSEAVRVSEPLVPCTVSV